MLDQENFDSVYFRNYLLIATAINKHKPANTFTPRVYLSGTGAWTGHAPDRPGLDDNLFAFGNVTPPFRCESMAA